MNLLRCRRGTTVQKHTQRPASCIWTCSPHDGAAWVEAGLCSMRESAVNVKCPISRARCLALPGREAPCSVVTARSLGAAWFLVFA